jgi:MoaA/NifB/PqqE/SkfB family radical SAM enzyme
VTAATSLGPTKAAALADAGPEMVMVSLLGDEATHDRRMGRAGAHRRAVATIERLVERRDPRRTRIILNCTIGPDDAPAIEAVARAGRDLGVDAVRFTWLSFMGASEAALAPRAHPYLVVDAPVAQPDARRGLIAAVAAARRAHPGFVDFLPHLTDPELDAWFGGGGLRRPCLSLWHTLFLRPDGHAVPCGHMQEDPVGDATQEPLGAFWNGDAMKRVRMAQRAGPFAMCARCCKN